MFLIQPDDEWSRLHPYEISGRHSFSLPGIRCPACQSTWATTGVAYPTVSSALLKGLCPPLSTPMSPEQFRRVASDIRRAIGERYPIYPGTEFGVLQGKAKGSIGDVAWVNPWTLLLRKSVLDKLQEQDIFLAHAKALLDGISGDLFKVEAIPIAKLHPKCLNSVNTERCTTCGRQAYGMPDEVVIEDNDFLKNNHIMRTREFPTLLIVSDAAANALRHLNIPNIKLSEVSTL